MKTHELILKILQILEDALDDKELNAKLLTAEKLGISKVRQGYILEMMQDAGLVKDVNFIRGGNTRSAVTTLVDNMQITLRGIMYLEENTTTAKIIKAAKLLKDTIPMI